MTMPIFNENWEYLPLNPIQLQPQQTVPKMTMPIKGNLPY